MSRIAAIVVDALHTQSADLVGESAQRGQIETGKGTRADHISQAVFNPDNLGAEGSSMLRLADTQLKIASASVVHKVWFGGHHTHHSLKSP